MDLPYFSPQFVNQTVSQVPLVSTSSVQTRWTHEANKAFENALAENTLVFPDIFHKIALIIPGKSIEEIMDHYEALVEDLQTIESGSCPLPNYKDVDDAGARLDTVGRPKSGQQEKKRAIRWTKEEHEKFLVGLEKYGKGDWKSISRNCVVTKNPTQVASHAQKYYIRIKKSLMIKPSLLVQTSNYLPSSSHFQL